MPSQGNRARSRLIAGFVALAFLIATWVAMSELLADLQKTYKKPFFITWILRVSYVIWLLPFYIMQCRRSIRLKKLKKEASANNSLVPVDKIPAPLLALSLRKALIYSIFLSILATACGYTWYKSLAETIVSLNNAIYQSSPLFVFVFSVFMLGEKVTLQKCLAVVVCTTGVILITFSKGSSDGGDPVDDTAMGYILVVVSTALYAIYEVLYAKYVDYEEEDDNDENTAQDQNQGTAEAESVEDAEEGTPAGVEMTGMREASPAEEEGLMPHGRNAVPMDDPQLKMWYVSDGKPAFATQISTSLAMLGYIGVATTLFQWPIIMILDATGAEVYEAPDTAGVLGTLLANCGLDTLFNVLLLFGISVTSPVFMSVGTMLVAPITVIVDALKPAHQGFDWKGWVGIICVVGAFVVLELPPRYTGFHKCNRLEPCRRKKASSSYHQEVHGVAAA